MYDNDNADAVSNDVQTRVRRTLDVIEALADGIKDPDDAVVAAERHVYFYILAVVADRLTLSAFDGMVKLGGSDTDPSNGDCDAFVDRVLNNRFKKELER